MSKFMPPRNPVRAAGVRTGSADFARMDAKSVRGLKSGSLNPCGPRHQAPLHGAGPCQAGAGHRADTLGIAHSHLARGQFEVEGHIETLGANGKSTIVWKSGEYVSVRATVRFHAALSDPVIGMLIRTQIGFEVYGTTTELEHVKIGPRDAGETVTVVFQFLCDLCPQPYTLTLAAQDPDGGYYDWLDDAVAFTVADERGTPGVANLRAKVSVETAPDEADLADSSGA